MQDKRNGAEPPHFVNQGSMKPLHAERPVRRAHLLIVIAEVDLAPLCATTLRRPRTRALADTLAPLTHKESHGLLQRVLGTIDHTRPEAICIQNVCNKLHDNGRRSESKQNKCCHRAWRVQAPGQKPRHNRRQRRSGRQAARLLRPLRRRQWAWLPCSSPSAAP